MIIRSQDKKSITTDLNLYIVHISIFKPEFWEIKNSMGEIATYSTEEKAIKVLDMICNFADEKHFEKIMMCDCIGGVVFNMPQDSEV